MVAINLQLDRRHTLNKIAYYYWFFENLKYGLALSFFSSLPVLHHMFTAITSIGCFLLAMAFAYRHIIVLKKAVVFPREIKLLAVFFFFSGISLFWSNATDEAFRFWVNVGLDMLTFLVICQLGNAEEVAVNSLKGFVDGTLLTTLWTMIVHPLEAAGTLDRLGQTGLLDAVRLGNMLALTSLFLIFLRLRETVPKKSKILMAKLVFALFGFLMTFYKAGTGSLILSAFLLLFLFPKPAKLKLKILAIACFGAIVILLSSYHKLQVYAGLLNGKFINTASGRTYLWETAWYLIKQDPFVGHGAGYKLRQDILEEVAPEFLDPNSQVERATQSNNEWLNMWLQYGIFGLALVVSVYLSFLMRSIHLLKYNPEVASISLALIAYHLFRSPFESILVNFLFPETLIIIFVFWMKHVLAMVISNGYLKPLKSTRKLSIRYGKPV